MAQASNDPFQIRDMFDREPSRHSQKTQRGFTLVEMLVSLVLTALITTVLTQGMGYLWQMDSHYTAILNHASTRDMHVAWWRESVRGLLVAPQDSSQRFDGKAHKFSGLGSNLLGRRPGLPGTVRWRISKTQTSAKLIGNGNSILSLPANSRFVYLDRNRQSHSHWSSNTGERPLPSEILIVENNKVVWAAAVLQPQQRPLSVNRQSH